ncbi:MAG: MFS transporter, partial [Clostridia bacterium]|nr:MFS transporter [Clostridia bacterium]
AGQFQGVRMIFAVLLPMVIGPMLGNFSSSASAVTYTDEFGVSQNAPTSAMFLCAAIVAVLVFLPLGFLIKKALHPQRKKTKHKK